MRKLFCKNDAADFEDLPAFNEEKVSLTMIVAGVCVAVVAVDDCLPAPQKQGLKFLIKYPRPGEVYFVGSGVLLLFEDGIIRPSRRRACRRRGSRAPCVSMAAADGRSAGTCYTENAESAQRT